MQWGVQEVKGRGGKGRWKEVRAFPSHPSAPLHTSREGSEGCVQWGDGLEGTTLKQLSSSESVISTLNTPCEEIAEWVQ